MNPATPRSVSAPGPSPSSRLPAKAVAVGVAAVTLALAGASSACGGADAARRGPTSYPQRVAARARAASELRVFRVRHNPTPCACPPWEVLLGGHWQRAQLVNDASGDEDPVAVLLDRAQGTDAVALGDFVVQGELDEDVSQCGRGAQVVELRVTALGRPEASPDAPVEPAPAEPPPQPDRRSGSHPDAGSPP